MNKRIVYLIITLCLVISLTKLPVNTANDSETNNNVRKKAGLFKYTSTASDEKDYRETYYYNDEYFYNSSYTYNESLATMSLCFAMASGGSNEKPYSTKSDNVKD